MMTERQVLGEREVNAEHSNICSSFWSLDISPTKSRKYKVKFEKQGTVNAAVAVRR